MNPDDFVLKRKLQLKELRFLRLEGREKTRLQDQGSGIFRKLVVCVWLAWKDGVCRNGSPGQSAERQGLFPQGRILGMHREGKEESKEEVVFHSQKWQSVRSNVRPCDTNPSTTQQEKRSFA